MSGGYFNNDCFGILDFAESLRFELQINDSEEKDIYDDRIAKGFSEETVKVLEQILARLEFDAKLAKEVEWLYSGDNEEETFRENTRLIGVEETHRSMI